MRDRAQTATLAMGYVLRSSTLFAAALVIIEGSGERDNTVNYLRIAGWPAPHAVLISWIVAEVD